MRHCGVKKTKSNISQIIQLSSYYYPGITFVFIIILLCLGFKSIINSKVAFVLTIHSDTVAEEGASSCAK